MQPRGHRVYFRFLKVHERIRYIQHEMFSEFDVSVDDIGLDLGGRSGK